MENYFVINYVTKKNGNLAHHSYTLIVGFDCTEGLNCRGMLSVNYEYV